HANCHASLSDLVFNEYAHWRHQFKGHLCGQSTDVMVCLDACCGRCRIVAGALNYIGIERSLGQERNWLTLFRQPKSFFFEYTDEFFAYDLTLLLRVDDTCKSSQETLACVDYDERDMQVAAEGID